MLIKLLFNGVVLADSAGKGMLTWRVMVSAVIFVVLLYATGLPAVILYQEHPQYKPLFIAAMVFDVALFAGYMFWSIRWYLRQLARRRAEAPSAAQFEPPA